MRAFIAILLSFQFINSVQAASIGEKTDFSINQHYRDELSQQAAIEFSKLVREELSELDKVGIAKYVTTSSAVKAQDQQRILQILNNARLKSIPAFEEKNGTWKTKIDTYTVSFSIVDLYLQQIYVNEKIISFKNIPVSGWETKIKQSLDLKTSSHWFRNLLIADAHAEPVSGVILLIAVAVVGAVLATMAWYNWNYKPKKAVAAMREVSKKLEQQAAQCERSKSERSDYESTYDLASNIEERSKLNSMTSADLALQYAMKEQINSGKRSNSDCYQASYEIGKKIGLDIPQITDRQLEMIELMGGSTKAVSETDTKGAIFGVCSAYNRLSVCMDGFIKAHVNDAEGFKDSAEQNFYRYQRSSGAQGQ